MKFSWRDLRPGDLVISYNYRGRLVISIERMTSPYMGCQITWMQLWNKVRNCNKIYYTVYDDSDPVDDDMYQLVRPE